jgi:hypothetical protein
MTKCLYGYRVVLTYMCFSCSYTTDQLNVGSKPGSSFTRASTTKSGFTQSSTTKSGSTLSSLTLPSFKDMSELFTPRIEVEILASSNLKAFSLSDLKAAIKNYHLDNLIGEGESNYVCKGWIENQTLAPSKLLYMV